MIKQKLEYGRLSLHVLLFLILCVVHAVFFISCLLLFGSKTWFLVFKQQLPLLPVVSLKGFEVFFFNFLLLFCFLCHVDDILLILYFGECIGLFYFFFEKLNLLCLPINENMLAVFLVLILLHHVLRKAIVL